MELNQVENNVIQHAEIESEMRDLSDLQLALISGGIGDVIVG